MRSHASGMGVRRHNRLPERVRKILHHLELDGFRSPRQGEASDDGLAVEAELGLGQALAGGSEYRLHAVVYAQANVGGTRRTLAENGARAVAQAGAALGAAAVDPEK